MSLILDWADVEADIYRLLHARTVQLDNILTIDDPSGDGGKLADPDTLQAMAAQVVERLQDEGSEAQRRAAMLAGLAADALTGEPSSGWWRTSAARACLIGQHANLEGIGVPLDRAGALLGGISRQAVADLIRRGKLDKLDTDTGVVDLASLRQRLVEITLYEDSRG